MCTVFMGRVVLREIFICYFEVNFWFLGQVLKKENDGNDVAVSGYFQP